MTKKGQIFLGIQQNNNIEFHAYHELGLRV